MKLFSRHKPGYHTGQLINSLCSEHDALLDTNKNLNSKLSFYEMQNAHLSEELDSIKGCAAESAPPSDFSKENLRLRCRNAWLEAELEKTKRELETTKRELETTQKAHEWLLEAHLRTVNTYLDLKKELPPNE